MTDEELIALLRDDSGNWLTDAAADRIEALTEQLAAARRDAEEAEAYAAELEKERDEFAAKLAGERLGQWIEQGMPAVTQPAPDAAARKDAEEAEAYARELEANGLANRVAIMRLEARAERLEEALRFYANDETYETQYERRSCGCCTDIFEPINDDRGAKARAALKGADHE